MTINEAILKSLQDIKGVASYKQIYDHIVKNKYHHFAKAGTPKATVSALLGNFIRDGDSRVKRIKRKGGYLYYLTKDEDIIDLDSINQDVPERRKKSGARTFSERDLHILLSSYLKNQGIYSKTIFHEQSKNSKDNHQKWVHPDMVGIKFLNLQNKNSQRLLKAVNRSDAFKVSSYELKKEINTDSELKKYFFQAVSNSSWANFGYLVVFDISDSLLQEVERLNQSFGIGLIHLKANPYESMVLFPARFKSLDFKTIDKLCKINRDFEEFIRGIEKMLSAVEGYEKAIEKEFEELCDDYFNTDSQISKYIEQKKIRNDDETEAF